MAKLMEETARKSGNRFQARLVERSLNNEPPIKFHEFCSLWTIENEAVFLDVFGSEEFAKTQKNFMSAQMRLKIQLNKLAEKALEQTPIALKRDIDLASKEILELKRDLRKSRKQQQQLEAEAKAARDASATAEKRIQKLETVIEKIQNIESALEKVQAQAETAETTAKSAIEQANKPVSKPDTKKSGSKPAVKTATKPATKTASKPATKTAPKKPAAAKKPAGTPTE